MVYQIGKTHMHDVDNYDDAMRCATHTVWYTVAFLFAVS
jgi:hypothetical protein